MIKIRINKEWGGGGWKYDWNIVIIQPPRPEKINALQQNNCGSGHPAFEEEGGELFVVLIYFLFSNVYRTISPPEKEEYPGWGTKAGGGGGIKNPNSNNQKPNPPEWQSRAGNVQ